MTRFLSGFFKFLTASLIAVLAVGSLSACTSTAPAPKNSATDNTVLTDNNDVAKNTSAAAIIDVRTPEETAAGYLEGALLIDIQSNQFDAEIAKLDKTANYVIYCRSGNRSGQAIEKMKTAGFTGKLTNGGSLADAAKSTGLAIVQ